MQQSCQFRGRRTDRWHPLFADNRSRTVGSVPCGARAYHGLRMNPPAPPLDPIPEPPRVRPEELVVARPEGLYCPAGDFYIDPWKPVERAVITHGHSDHARWGHGHYLAHTHSEGTLRQRLGADIALQTLPYG